MPNESVPNVPKPRSPDRILKDVGSAPIIHDRDLKGILRGNIPETPRFESPEGVIAALKSGDPGLMRASAELLTQEQRLKTGTPGRDKARTDEQASAVLSEAEKTGKLGALEVRADEDDSSVLHIRDPKDPSTEMRHVKGQGIEAEAVMRPTFDQLVQSRDDAWTRLNIDMPGWSPTSAVERMEYEARIGPIDAEIGGRVAEAMRILGLSGKLDLTGDLGELTDKLEQKIDWNAEHNARRFTPEVKEAALYFKARAEDREAKADPSLPVEAAPWEWREKEPPPRSQFEQVLDRITVLRDEVTRGLRLGTDPELAFRQNERDQMLEDASNIELVPGSGEKDFFDPVKIDLISTYFDSRVKVTREMKDGTDVYSRGAGKLHDLEGRRGDARAQGDDSWESKNRFWSGLRTEAMREKYGGTADYVNLQTTDLITDLVRDRKRYQDPVRDPYPDDAMKVCTKIWEWKEVRTRAGPIVVDATGEAHKAGDFDDIRSIIEEQRRMEPTVASSGYDPVTPFRFVADDREELLEMIPYMLRKVDLRITPSQAQKAIQELDGEESNLIKTLSAFPGLSAKWRRRIKSAITTEFEAAAAFVASTNVHESWDAFFHFMEGLARGTHAIEGDAGQEHMIDSLFLDKEGHTMSSLERLCENDGLFWRYGLSAADTASENGNMAKNYKWQHDKIEEIREQEMSRRLKPMWKVLGLPDPEPDPTLRQPTEPIHPAFARLKVKLDALDLADPARGTPRFVSRWQEYRDKAFDWQKNGTPGDPSNPGRVIFQHPLARAFRPVGFIDKAGNATRVDEMEQMYEEDTRIHTDKWYKAEKGRKVDQSIARARRIARGFLIDSESALAWHTFPNDTVANEANYYLSLIGERPRTKSESVPYKTLYRGMMQAIIDKDQELPMVQRQLKMYSLMTENWGLDLDVPVAGLWRLGAHDGIRPVLLKKIDRDEKALRQVVRDSAAAGFDEKNLVTSWVERERRIGILLDIVMKAKFGTKGGSTGEYFNFPGHDDHDAGIKDVRNLLRLIYGQSARTVRLNGLIPVFGHLGGNTFGRDVGATRSPGRQMVGLYKCEDEVAFAETGYAGYIEGPRDMEDAIKRQKKMKDQSTMLTSGKDGINSILNDGPFSGMFEWRAMGRDTHIYTETGGKHFETHSLHDPVGAWDQMLESGRAKYTAKGASATKPLATFMKGTIESTFGKNPESAKWLNTFYWHGTSQWMNTREFRDNEGPAYAIDGNLFLARQSMHTAMLDDGLIMEDKKWDAITLGTVKVYSGFKDSKEKDGRGKRTVVRYSVGSDRSVLDYKMESETRDGVTLPEKVVFGKALEVGVEAGQMVRGSEEPGLLDAFPDELRAEVIENNWLPMGLNSYYPETLAPMLDGESPANQAYYEPALVHVRPRTLVYRPGVEDSRRLKPGTKDPLFPPGGGH